MTGTALLFFLLFAITVLITYLAVRRAWARTGPVTLVGAVVGIVTMFFFARGQGNSVPQALVAGVLVGSIFIAAAVSIAGFFRSSEARDRAE